MYKEPDLKRKINFISNDFHDIIPGIAYNLFTCISFMHTFTCKTFYHLLQFQMYLRAAAISWMYMSQALVLDFKIFSNNENKYLLLTKPSTYKTFYLNS